jgi:hypothetical protein
MSKPLRLMRPRQIYGAGNPLPVGRSLFYEKYVQRPGEDENVPGTKVKKLRLDHIGGRLAIAPEDRVFDFVAALLADAIKRGNELADAIKRGIEHKEGPADRRGAAGLQVSRK